MSAEADSPPGRSTRTCAGAPEAERQLGVSSRQGGVRWTGTVIAAPLTSWSRTAPTPRGRERGTSHVTPRADPAADAGDRAAGPQSVDGPHGRGGGLPGGLSRRRLDRLPEGRARGDPERDRDVPGRRRHRRRLVAPADPRRACGYGD